MSKQSEQLIKEKRKHYIYQRTAESLALMLCPDFTTMFSAEEVEAAFGQIGWYSSVLCDNNPWLGAMQREVVRLSWGKVRVERTTWENMGRQPPLQDGRAQPLVLIEGGEGIELAIGLYEEPVWFYE